MILQSIDLAIFSTSQWLPLLCSSALQSGFITNSIKGLALIRVSESFGILVNHLSRVEPLRDVIKDHFEFFQSWDGYVLYLRSEHGQVGIEGVDETKVLFMFVTKF